MNGTTGEVQGEAANDSETGVARAVGDAKSGEKATPIKRPRARVPAVSAQEAGIPMSRFGAVPVGVTHWVARRRSMNGDWEPCGHVPAGAIAEERTFPLSELSEQTLADRWGPGLYEISWVRPLANGGRNVLRGTCEVRIVDPAVVAPPAAPAAAASPFGESFDLACKLMGMIETQSQSKLNAQVEMAKLFAGQQRSNGLGAAELQLILQSNAAATEKAIAAAVAPLHAKIEAMGDDEDDEDDDMPGLADAARAAAPLIKGKGTLASVLNFASANPKLVEMGLPIVANAFSALASVVASAKPAPAPALAEQAPPARPRAVVVPVSTPEHERHPTLPTSENGSLSGWRTSGDPKPESKPTDAPIASSA